MSIIDDFEKAFTKDSGFCTNQYMWYAKSSAKWGFIQGLRKAAQLAYENEHTGVYVENAIMRAVKELEADKA